MLVSGENILSDEAPHIPLMKRFLLMTVIVFSTFACERHSVGENPQVQVEHTPFPKPSPQDGPELKWDATGIMTAALALVTLVASAASIIFAVRTERVFKGIKTTLAQAQARSEDATSVETMMACMEQYQDLENKVEETEISNPNRYFELLWNLHFAEYYFWKRRFLPDELYALWIIARYNDFKADKRKDSPGWTEAAGWTHAKKYLGDAEFTNFVEPWLNASTLSIADVRNLLGKVPRSPTVINKT